MAGIGAKSTAPEIAIRKELFAHGYRYRLNVKALPGCPDIVLKKFNAVIFVHGCFWHLHDCKYFKWPKSRPEFWRKKLIENQKRDERSRAALEISGWRVKVVWECDIKNQLHGTIEDLIRWIEV